MNIPSALKYMSPMLTGGLFYGIFWSHTLHECLWKHYNLKNPNIIRQDAIHNYVWNTNNLNLIATVGLASFGLGCVTTIPFMLLRIPKTRSNLIALGFSFCACHTIKTKSNPIVNYY